MAAFGFRTIYASSKRNRIIHPRHNVLINSFSQSKNTITNSHSESEGNSKSPHNTYLTYPLITVGALSVGYTLHKWKDDISIRIFNNQIANTSIVYAKNICTTDINENRNQYNFIADVVEISGPSVVCIEINDHKRMDMFRGKLTTTSNGSGFIVSSDGLILTNAHVVNKPNTLVKVRLQDGNTYMGRVEDVDLQSDLATVRINKNNLPVMKLGSSATIRPGEFVVAIGSPLTLSNTITSGVVSSVKRQSEELGLYHKHMVYIQTDAAITFGNSGGPLVNLNGEAIGINAMKVMPGISFAIPIDYAKEFLKKAEARRNSKDQVETKYNVKDSTYRFLGITLLHIGPSLIYQIQHRNSMLVTNVIHGLIVSMVIDGSPADVGGLKPGDIITHVNDVPVTEILNIYTFLEKAGTFTMTISRNETISKIHINP